MNLIKLQFFTALMFLFSTTAFSQSKKQQIEELTTQREILTTKVDSISDWSDNLSMQFNVQRKINGSISSQNQKLSNKLSDLNDSIQRKDNLYQELQKKAMDLYYESENFKDSIGPFLTDRVLVDELTNKGTDQKPTMYFEGALFNGVGFDVYEDGQLESETNYKDGKRNGLVKSWYPNGQLLFEGNYKDGEEDGLCQQWHENGQLKYEDNYKDGKPDGFYKGWYEDGQLRFEGNYKDGLEDGLAKYWFRNGQLKSEINHNDGKMNGFYKEWYENGQLKSESNYKDGVKQ